MAMMLDEMLKVNVAGHFRDMPRVVTVRAEPMDYLLIWVVRGRVTGRYGAMPLAAEGGDLLLFEPGVGQWYESPAAPPWEWLWVHFDGPGGAELARAIGAHGRPRCRLGRPEPVRQRFDELLLAYSAARAEPAGTRPSAARLAHAACHHLLAEIVHQLDLNRRLAGDERTSLDPHALQRYIHDHLHEPIRLDDLAREAHLSPAHFTRLFRRLFGVSPMRYVIERRIDRACTLLTQTDMKLTHIAQTVGYDDGYYFSRLFRKVTGQTPSAYRRTHRGG